ncbi:hypothetical protein [Citreimonas salinaria]|nr:hypothetical protein [Citreimonas salinaria]
MDGATAARAGAGTARQDAARPGCPADPVLDHLRRTARSSRCKSYVDLFGACASMSGNRQVAAQAASDVLMRCLSQALGRRPVLYREGEREMSFDEAWLMALVRSLQADDVASATFLLHSRVPKHARRNLVFLLQRVAEDFDQV